MRKRKIIVCISGGIAAYKVIALIQEFKKNDWEVAVVMTQNATKIISSKEVEKKTSVNTYTDLFPTKIDYRKIDSSSMPHIKLADEAEAIVVAPATANIIGKIANGIGDDLLTTILLASHSPVFICPSMNVNMWNNLIVQQNINKLKSVGYNIISPTYGDLACGYKGVGRMQEPEIIAQQVLDKLT